MMRTFEPFASAAYYPAGIPMLRSPVAGPGRLPSRSLATAAICVCLAGPLVGPVRGADPPAAPAPAATAGTRRLSFEQLVERIRRAEATGDWRREGWTDPIIAQGLDLLVTEADRATPNHDVKLPVPLAGLAPAGGGGGVPMVQKALLVGRDISVSHASGCVLLADGNARVAFAEGCVIVARGAVYIAHGRRNVVVAGQYVHSSFDGDPGRMAGGGEVAGSLLVSGGVVDVSHAFDSVCSAPGLVRIGNAYRVAFLDSPNVKAGTAGAAAAARRGGAPAGPDMIENAKLSLAPPAAVNPLDGVVRVTQVIYRDDPKECSAVVDADGVEVVVRPGAEVKDGRGQVVRGAQGWRLSFIGPDFALFSDGRRDAGFFVARRRGAE